MQKFTYVLIAICLPFLSLAQPDNEQRYDSKMTFDLKIDDKDPHVLFIGCKEGECDVYWNQQKITSEHSFDAAVDFIRPIQNEDYPNLFLIPIYNGDGCPSMYKLLQIPTKKEFWLTKSFGNCNELEYSIKKKTMTIDFEELMEEQVKRPKQSYTYNLKKGELVKVE